MDIMAPRCNWFKILKRTKKHRQKRSQDQCRCRSNQLTEEEAAIRIQSAIRGYRARRMYWRLKGILRLQGVGEGEASTVKQQSISALNHIDLWRRMQGEIKSRRIGMVTESLHRRIMLEKKIRIEAKHHELEVEWCSDTNSMEGILQRIKHKEEAAERRERALAYAFSHQWRPNSSKDLGHAYFDVSKESWGWSWKQRWVAIRPWQTRCHKSRNLNRKTETNHTKRASRKQIFPKGAISDTLQGQA